MTAMGKGQEGRGQRAKRALRTAALCALLVALHPLPSALLPFALGPSSFLHAETIDRVLAVVNGDLITLSDVMAAKELGLVAAEGSEDPVKAVLAQLIDRALELDEVDRYAPPEPSADAVDAEVRLIRGRFPSPAAFDAALSRTGLDLSHLRETVRENLRARAYLDQRFVAAADRRQPLVDDWLAGLRRRAEIVDLYSTNR